MEHTMHLFGAGLGRTGTTSVQRALEQLGYRAYNMEAVLREDHFAVWERIFRSEAEPDWPALYAGYNATIAWPSCFFYRELMVAYPEALFILTTRDPERWADSFLSAHKVLTGLRALRFVPRARALTRFVDGMLQKGMLGEGELDRAQVIEALTRHNEAVQRTIPPERLLVYEVQQGWEPLCRFLDKPVPATPFPHENKGEDFKQMVYRLLGVGAPEEAA